MSVCELTVERAREVLAERFGGRLRTGLHNNGPSDGECCVRELRAYACGLDWSDHPDGDKASPTDAACQALNDAAWSSDEVRTQECLILATLSEATAPDGWVARYAALTIREILPLALEAAASVHPATEHAEALLVAAKTCAEEGSESAASAAWSAAWSAQSAAWSAASAADSTARDDALRKAVALLVRCHRGGAA